MKYKKWLGSGLGWVLGGPIGGVLGFALGSMLDESDVKDAPKVGSANKRFSSSQGVGDFTVSLLVLSAAVMKSDGKALKSELDFVKKFLVKQFGAERAKEQVLMLKDILGKDIPLRDVCLQVKQFMPHAQRLQIVHYLFGISKADGHVHELELKTIQSIANYLGVRAADFESMKAMYFKDATSNYKILELSPTATDDEVKKAYRKMAIKFHPDKVASLGEEVQKAAKEKFQQVQHAYDAIKKERGLI